MLCALSFLLALSLPLTVCSSSLPSILLNRVFDADRSIETPLRLVRCMEICRVSCDSPKRGAICDFCMDRCESAAKEQPILISEGSGVIQSTKLSLSMDRSLATLHLELGEPVDLILIEYCFISGPRASKASPWMFSQATRTTTLAVLGMEFGFAYQMRISVIRGGLVVDRKRSNWVDMDRPPTGYYERN